MKRCGGNSMDGALLFEAGKCELFGSKRWFNSLTNFRCCASYGDQKQVIKAIPSWRYVQFYEVHAGHGLIFKTHACHLTWRYQRSKVKCRSIVVPETGCESTFQSGSQKVLISAGTALIFPTATARNFFDPSFQPIQPLWISRCWVVCRMTRGQICTPWVCSHGFSSPVECLVPHNLPCNRDQRPAWGSSGAGLGKPCGGWRKDWLEVPSQLGPNLSQFGWHNMAQPAESTVANRYLGQVREEPKYDPPIRCSEFGIGGCPKKGPPQLVLSLFDNFPSISHLVGEPNTSMVPFQVHQHLYDWILLRKCMEDSGHRQVYWRASPKTIVLFGFYNGLMCHSESRRSAFPGSSGGLLEAALELVGHPSKPWSQNDLLLSKVFIVQQSYQLATMTNHHKP